MLFIHLNPHGSQEWARQALEPGPKSGYRVQRLSSLDMACARTSGGGVAGIIVDLTGPGAAPADALLDELNRRLPGIVTAVLVSDCSATPETDAPILDESGSARLVEILRKRAAAVPGGPREARRGGGRVVAFIGVKGGVGTTTTAINVATALTRNGPVGLAEIYSGWSGLHDRLGSYAKTPGLEALVAGPAEAIDARSIETLMWEVQEMPRLRVLAAPPLPRSPVALTATHVDPLLQGLAGCSPWTVLDVGRDEGDAARRSLLGADFVIVVGELTPFAVHLAGIAVNRILQWGVPPRKLAYVLVNRVAIPNPESIEDVRRNAPARLIQVVPPAAEACSVSEKEAAR